MLSNWKQICYLAEQGLVACKMETGGKCVMEIWQAAERRGRTRDGLLETAVCLETYPRLFEYIAGFSNGLPVDLASHLHALSLISPSHDVAPWEWEEDHAPCQCLHPAPAAVACRTRMPHPREVLPAPCFLEVQDWLFPLQPEDAGILPHLFLGQEAFPGQDPKGHCLYVDQGKRGRSFLALCLGSRDSSPSVLQHRIRKNKTL